MDKNGVLKGPLELLDIVTDPQIGIFKSKQEAKKRLAEGFVRADGQIVHDPKTIFEKGTVNLQFGKRTAFTIKID